MIFFDDGTNPELIYEMWQRNFRDPVSYAEFYFQEVYGKNKVILEEEDGNVRGMIHLNPYRICIGDREMPASYICGVATDEEYRRMGIMRRMLEFAFQSLREAGESFTYLMPADERYYLPFGFRFGSAWTAQEVTLIEKVSENVEEAGVPLTFTEDPDDAAELALLENRKKREDFDLYTKIDASYLERLKKEARADYGHLFYVFDQEEYLGRFIVSMDHGFLMISQVFCMAEDRLSFIRSVLAFCKREYHYVDYQMILDSSWKENASDFPKIKHPGFRLRCLPVKQEDKIMFRILDLEKMAEYVSMKEDMEGVLYVEDPNLPEQEARYRMTARQGRLYVKKLPREGDSDFGKIPIAGLTQFLFRGKAEPELTQDLTKEGHRFMQAVKMLDRCCIMEYV